MWYFYMSIVFMFLFSFSDDTVHDVCGGAEPPYHGEHHCTLS